jgi:hypothetical protein
LSPEVRHLVEASHTLGAAFLAGLQPRAECQRGPRRGPVKVEPCRYVADLDLESLIWARGAKYPCWRLNGRLRCPRCGGLAVEVTWWLGMSRGARAAQDLYQCAIAAGKA